MAKKKKPVKKAAIKKNVKTKRPAAKKAVAKKPSAKKVSKKKPAPAKAAGGLRVAATPTLEARLKALAKTMGKSLDQILVQAMTEFADTWEEHHRTVAALSEGNDRMQLVVPQE